MALPSDDKIPEPPRKIEYYDCNAATTKILQLTPSELERRLMRWLYG